MMKYLVDEIDFDSFLEAANFCDLDPSDTIIEEHSNEAVTYAWVYGSEQYFLTRLTEIARQFCIEGWKFPDNQTVTKVQVMSYCSWLFLNANHGEGQFNNSLYELVAYIMGFTRGHKFNFFVINYFDEDYASRCIPIGKTNCEETLYLVKRKS